MPRVHYVKKAAKDNSVVSKGEPYYWWKFRRGGKHLSKTRPRGSQLTQSDKLSRAYACAEQLEDMDRELDWEQAQSDVESVAAEIRDIAEEYRDSVQNMPEGLQQSPVAEECEQKADDLDSWAESLESEAGNWDEDTDVASALDDLEGCPI